MFLFSASFTLKPLLLCFIRARTFIPLSLKKKRKSTAKYSDCYILLWVGKSLFFLLFLHAFGDLYPSLERNYSTWRIHIKDPFQYCLNAGVWHHGYPSQTFSRYPNTSAFWYYLLMVLIAFISNTKYSLHIRGWEATRLPACKLTIP